MKREWDGPSSDGWAKRGKATGKGTQGGRGLPRTKCAFKALCTENVVGAMLRNKGQVKDTIQEETGAKIVFSNKGDYFPNSQLRVLGLYAEDVGSISRALEIVVEKVVELGEEERQRPPAPGCELLGKEDGEYIFRICLSGKMAGLTIGSQGSNVQKLRQETGAKVFIDNGNFAGHRAAKVIGTPAALVTCITRLNDMIQAESEADDFQFYASLINFGEVADGGHHDGHHGRADPSPGHHAAVIKPPLTWQLPPKTEPRAWRSTTPTHSQGHSGDQSPARSGIAAKDDFVRQSLDFLADNARGFPPGALELPYAIFFELSCASLTDLEEAKGLIEEETSTNINFESPSGPSDSLTVVQLQGSLLCVYAAHLMLVRKAQEIDTYYAERQNGEVAEDNGGEQISAVAAADLQRQVLALQKQLDELKQSK